MPSRCTTVLLLALVVGALRPSLAGAAGPDAFGYRSLHSGEVAGPPFLPFVDISITGTQVTFVDADDVASLNADDGVALDLPLVALNGGRGFPFYGTFLPSVAMSTNGFLDFQPSLASDIQTNQCPLPDATIPNTLIAALWDDLVLTNPPDASRGGFQQAFSACPYPQGGDGSCVIFEWHRADHLTGSVDAFSFQAVLYDNGNVLVSFAAGNLEEGIGSTTGIEGRGILGVTDACDQAGTVPPESSVLFLAPPFAAATVSEVEPNDAAATASALPTGRCGAGGIASAGDADLWAVPPAGTRLYGHVDTRFAAPSTTSSLAVLAAGGTSVLATGSAIAGLVVPEAGVLLRVTEVGDNAALAPYELTALVASAEDRRAESETNDTPGTANPVEAAVMSGTVVGADADVFAFAVERVSDAITVLADVDPDRDGGLANVAIEVIGPDGTTLLAASDPLDSGQTVAVGRLIAAAPGTYFVRVTQAPGAVDADYDIAVLVNCASACGDGDGDGHCNVTDNCRATANDQVDVDADGVGDACDACAADAGKSAPGLCGCGVVDGDANGNGVVDCRVNDELRERLGRLRIAVEALRRQRGKRRDDPAAIAAHQLLAEVRDFLATNGSTVTLIGGADLASLTEALATRVGRATKTRKPRFGSRRRTALAAIDALRDAVAAP